jgi:radical SAM-linked protein
MSSRYLITFSKVGRARFLSHLDLQATIEYALRRAALPVQLSEGFNPRPRYSVVTALSLGHHGIRELLELTLRDELSADEVGRRLGAALPDGIDVLAVKTLPAGSGAVAVRLRSACYRVGLAEPVPDLETRAASLLDRDAIDIEEERNGKMRCRNIRPLILELQADGDCSVRLVTSLTNDGSVRPEEILRQLGIDPTGATITREWIEIAPLSPVEDPSISSSA